MYILIELLFNQTPISKWHMTRVVAKHGHQKYCTSTVRFNYVLNIYMYIIHYFRINSEQNWHNLYDHLKE